MWSFVYVLSYGFNVFLNFIRIILFGLVRVLVVVRELVRGVEILNIFWINFVSFINRLDEECERKRGIKRNF